MSEEVSVNDALLMYGTDDSSNPAAGLPVTAVIKNHEIIDEVWEEKNDNEINVIECTSISFTQDSLEMIPGETKILSVEQDPFISNLPYLVFESSDLYVVQIINNNVAMACCEGEATITATAIDNPDLVATLSVTVSSGSSSTDESTGDNSDEESGDNSGSDEENNDDQEQEVEGGNSGNEGDEEMESGDDSGEGDSEGGDEEGDLEPEEGESEPEEDNDNPGVEGGDEEIEESGDSNLEPDPEVEEENE